MQQFISLHIQVCLLYYMHARWGVCHEAVKLKDLGLGTIRVYAATVGAAGASPAATAVIAASGSAEVTVR